MRENDIRTILAGTDRNIEPSRELERDTVAKMYDYSRKTPIAEQILDHPKVKKSGKLTLILAATLTCVALLMGAGFRVFEHIFYLPGEGIVIDDFRDSLVMEYATQIGGHYIEAASLMPNEEGNLDLTVITDMEARFREDVRSLTLVNPDGTAVTKEGSTKFVFKNVEKRDSYTLRTDEGGEATIEMVAIDSYEYSVYKYPVSNGVTLVMFPLSKGSSMLTYTTAYDVSNEPENLRELAKHSSSYYAELNDCDGSVVITDVNGETYRPIGKSCSFYYMSPVGENGFIRAENVIRLDKRLTAEIATIEIRYVSLYFNTTALMDKTEILVPQLDETLVIEEQFVDKFGIKTSPNSVTYKYTPQDGHNGKPTWSAIFEYDSEDFRGMDGVDYVLETDVLYTYHNALTGGKYRGGSVYGKLDSSGDYHFLEWRKTYIGDYEGSDGFVGAGDTMAIDDRGVIITIAGDWLIDFTDKVEKPAPTESSAEVSAEPTA